MVIAVRAHCNPLDIYIYMMLRYKQYHPALWAYAEVYIYIYIYIYIFIRSFKLMTQVVILPPNFRLY